MLDFLKARLPGIFAKPAPKKRGGSVEAVDTRAGNLRYAFERKQLPGPGAMNAAFMTLGLPQESPISRAVAVRGQLAVVAPAQITQQVVLRQPTPTEAGSLVLAGLADPDSGFGSPYSRAPLEASRPVIRW